MNDPGQIAERTKRHPLSKVQLAVLRKLDAEGPRQTAISTWGVYVCGTATAALCRRGLVRAQGIRWGSAIIEGVPEYVITKEGRRVLARIETHGDTCDNCGHHKPHHTNGIGLCHADPDCSCRRYRVRR